MRRQNITLLMLLMLFPAWTADAQRQASPEEAEDKMNSRRSMQWYVIEPLAPCPEEFAEMAKEERYDLDSGHREFKARLKEVTFEELTGFPATGLEPELEDIKLQLATDLVAIYQKGRCEQSRTQKPGKYPPRQK